LSNGEARLWMTRGSPFIVALALVAVLIALWLTVGGGPAFAASLSTSFKSSV
jgi:hypothetical protein